MSPLRRLALLLFLLCSLPRLAWSERAPADVPHRPRVGVVLSGGGARGVGHISILRAIEKAGIPIDYIAGTSMGALVGGLYAMGYSTDQLDSMVRVQDWDFVLTDRAPNRELSPQQRERAERYVLNVPLNKAAKPELNGLVSGRNMGNLLARLTVGYHDSIAFDSLPIPFACVATNLANGEEVDFRSGVLSLALRATMAVPGAFSPVVWNGTSLVDGGLVNNFPVDLARRMGADIVIGATVQRVFGDSLEQVGVQDMVQQLLGIMSRRKFEENIRDCDLHLRIDSRGVASMDFSPAHIDTMLQRGAEVAEKHWPELLQIAEKVRAAGDSAWVKKRVAAYGQPPSNYPVRAIRFDSITVAEERIIRRACRLSDYSTVTQAQIEQAVRLLGERFLYLNVNYALSEVEAGYDLIFHARRRLGSKVGVGARFDTEELAALLLDAQFVFHTHVPSSLDLAVRLSKQYAVRLGYTVEPWLNRQLCFFYDYRHRDVDVYHEGERAYNLVYQHQLAGLSYAYRNIRNFDGEAGVQLARYDFRDVLANEPASGVAQLFPSDTYFTAYARLKYNSQDRPAYPTAGSKLWVEYAFTTDNLTHLRRPHSFSTVQAGWESVLRLHRRWALLPRFSGRLVLGQDVPYVFRNAVGGLSGGKYVDQQLPFAGIGHVEFVRNALLMGDVKLRYNFLPRQYATLLVSCLAEQRDAKHLGSAAYRYGLGLQYGYDFKFGAVQATIGYASPCRRPTFYLSIGHDF